MPEIQEQSSLPITRQTLAVWAEEAAKLQAEVEASWPERVDDTQGYLDSLVVARGASARLSQLRALATQTRGAMRRAAADMKRKSDEAWDDKAKNRPGKGSDFTGPRERYSEYNVATLEERRKQHFTEQLLAEVEETYEVLRIFADEVSSARQDASRVIGHLQWLDSLGR